MQLEIVNVVATDRLSITHTQYPDFPFVFITLIENGYVNQLAVIINDMLNIFVQLTRIQSTILSLSSPFSIKNY
jgi:hypothetical protein